MRHSASRLGLLLLPLVLLLSPGMVLAQGQPAPVPASQADMNLYTRIAALNVCIARAGGIEFDKAVAVAGETIAQVIQGQHGGQIAQVGTKPLSIEELRKGSINSAVLGAVEVCPNEVPADVRKKVSEVIKQAGGGGGAPAAKPAPAAAPAPAAKP
ncbi:MAG: cAMP phosphodiesterase [Vulcanococcus sp.]